MSKIRKKFFSTMRSVAKKSARIILCTLLVGLVFTMGCEKLKNLREGLDGGSLLGTPPLQGTKWKLMGIFDVVSDTLIKELEPYDCAECYSFTFDTDSTAIGRSTSNILGVMLKPTIRVFLMTDALGTDFYLEDAILFRNAIETIISYQLLSNNELRFYYNGNNNYLKFEKIGG